MLKNMFRLLLVCIVIFIFVLLLSGCTDFNESCVIEEDCSDRILVHTGCMGDWICVEKKCAWKCNEEYQNVSIKGVFDNGQSPNDNQYDEKNKTLKASSNATLIFLTRAICKEYGGYWDECASSCRHENETFCIQVCEETCICGTENDFTCPPGYSCKIYEEESYTGECVIV